MQIAIAVLLFLFFAASYRAAKAPMTQKSASLRCLIIGGGPDRGANPVALENNIIYVHSLLPSDTPLRVLYAGADLSAPIVRIEKDLPSGDPEVSYRASSLTHVDGPSTLESFRSNLASLSQETNTPILLYFTGHGAPDPSGDFEDNAYELWGENQLLVSDFSDSLSKVPESDPVTVVMVQCFSGAFADSFFTRSTQTHPVVRPNSCGFFATIPSREAAGCTPDVNQADYRDFTTFFFGALTGRDRVGRSVPSADYDHDGKVEMDEAYCYTLGHDTSIDTPMATSDAYVRRFCDTSDRDVFQTPYKDIVSWSSPAQRAALDDLSTELKLSGDDRDGRAFSVMMHRVQNEDWDDTEEQDEETGRWVRFVRLCKTIALEHQILAQGTPEVRAGLQEILAAEHGSLPLAKSQMYHKR
jgi:hypothetical protein